MPIIIFTKPEHAAYYKGSIEEAGASMVSSQAALFAKLQQDLSRQPEELIVNHVGQS
jgi:hypothetical protein